MKQIKYLLIFLIAATTIVSCSKNFTSVTPTNYLNADSAITSVSNVRTAVNGLYAGMTSSDYYGRTAVLIPDLTADNVYRSGQAGVRYSSWAAGTVTNGDAYAQGMWDRVYSIIINANTIINKAPALHPTGTDSLELRQLIGESYAVRALAYFDLVRFFAYSYTKITDSTQWGVPIVLNSYAEDTSQLVKPARATTIQTYAQVISDINTALTYLPTSGNVLSKGSIANDLSKIRLNYFSVCALAARVYLYEKDYTDAAKYASIVINSNKYSLLPAATMVNDFHTQANNESIFEVANNSNINQGNNSIAYIFNQNGYGEMLAPDTMWRIYDSSDVRGPYQGQQGFIFPGNRNAFGGETNTLIINKYNNISDFQENIKVFRLAEMYLIRSEALAYSAQSGTAGMPDLLTVSRARNEIDPSPTQDGTLTTFVPLILLENRKEFAFEGHRIFDLTRISSITATDPTTTYSYEHYKFQTLTAKQLARSGKMSSTLKKYAIMPIPYTEIKNDPALVGFQNLGY